MRILVTGAGGFIGRATVAEFLKKRHEIFCLVSPKSENIDDLPNILRGDVGDFGSLTEFQKLENIDTIIHATGLAHQFGKVADEEFWRVNVKGTKNMARLAVELKAKHFILISSVAVYGKVGKNEPIDETDVCRPQGIYARSKFEAEKAAREICEQNDMALTILRPATVIGENDRGNTARLIAAIDKRRFLWIGKGENLKSLIYKQDVARACLKVLEKKTSRAEIFNVTGAAVKMNFVVSEIAKNLHRKIPKLAISVPVLKKIFRVNAKTAKIEKISNLAETVEKWVSDDVFSGEKIAETYGFRAETPIAEAIRRQVEFYKYLEKDL